MRGGFSAVLDVIIYDNTIIYTFTFMCAEPKAADDVISLKAMHLY